MIEILNGKVAVVTGASRGIGRAIALRLASAGATVCVVGRDRGALEATVRAMPTPDRARVVEADLLVDGDVHRISQVVRDELKRTDVLVHSAGMYGRGAVSAAPIDQLDDLYRANVRAPYLLTQLLLPQLIASQGNVVFMNSTQGLRTSATLSHYGATQHALKGFAESLRDELNPQGVRVVSIYPGRTATPRMEEVYRLEGRPYRPELLMQPDDVAAVVVNALMLPRTAEVTDVMLRPMLKSY
jgi:NAD(P)-dependent dehydrogenase (short-subunit alcohol dehydrogenase family)